MADAFRVEVSKVSRAKGKVKKSWISVKSRFKRTLGIKQPIEIISSPHVQVEIDPYPEEPADIVPSPREAYTSGHLPVPEDNRTCTSLSSLSGLQKFESGLRAASPSEPANLHDHTAPTNDHFETALQRQETCPNESVRSDVAVFGDVEKCTSDDMIAITITRDQTQKPPIDVQNVQDAPGLLAVARGTPVQPTPLQETPVHDKPVQIQRNAGMTQPAVPVPTPVFTPAPPEDTPAHPGGKPRLFLFTPNRQPMLLDPQNPQQYTPIKPTNHLQSPSPCMVIPALGASPLTKKISPTAPNSPEMPPTPLKHQDLMPEAIDPLLDGQRPPLPPRSPRRPPPQNIDPILPADDEKKDFGVIGDRRAAKNQPQPRAVEELADNPGKNKEGPPAEAKPTQDGADGLQQEGIAQIPEHPYPQPIYVRQDKYYVGRYLGGGGTGKVYSVLNTETLSVSALKVIKRKELRHSGLSIVKEELNIMKALTEIKYLGPRAIPEFRFVVHLVESWYDKDNIYLNMPLCVGTLYDRLRRIKLDPLTIKVYAAELMSGLEALHDIKIIHCDLKPDNILVCPDGHLKISDFGLSVSWLDPRYNNHPPHSFRGRRLGGTDGYMAPEIVSAYTDPQKPRRGNYGFAADIFSLGIIFAELDMDGSRFLYFENEEEKEHWKGDYARFSRATVLSREMLLKRVQKKLRGDHALLVERMIEIRESSRATIDEIAAHPFFSELDMERVLNKGYPVPLPPLETVLPCRHACVEDKWFSRRGSSEGADKYPSTGVSEHSVQQSGLMQDIDQFIIPESFVWNLDEEIRRHERRMYQLAIAQTQGGPQAQASG